MSSDMTHAPTAAAHHEAMQAVERFKQFPHGNHPDARKASIAHIGAIFAKHEPTARANMAHGRGPGRCAPAPENPAVALPGYEPAKRREYA